LATERYEQLRCLALGASTTVPRDGGLDMLVRNGMARWMDAWASCCVAQQPDATTERVQLPAAHHEVVVVLAELALSAIGKEDRV